MFSFVGDRVLDPFMGTGTTSLACAAWGRNSVGVELDPAYFEIAGRRLEAESATLLFRQTGTPIVALTVEQILEEQIAHRLV